MKIKTIMPISIFLSLFLVSQSAQAFWWLFRIPAMGGRVASVARTTSTISKAGRVAKSSKNWGRIGQEALMIGASGIVANEAYGYYEQYQSENGQAAPQPVFNSNSQPTIKAKPQEHYMYVNTIKLGDPDLVW